MDITKNTFGSMTALDSTDFHIVQEKFRGGETVKALLRAYQIIGNETPNRLLALVTAFDTNAIFSFAVARFPPTSFSDLTIDNIFPMDEHFKIQTGEECQHTISKLRFMITSNSEQFVFYYHSSEDSLDEFNTFHRRVESTLIENYGNTLSREDFMWLNPYIRKDFEAIDRCIADGTKPLKKGESKFQDELKKHEHEYIVYKKYRIFCATWNVNGQSCNDIPLNDWLSITEEPPDIYAIAFQELDLSPKAITFNESRPDQALIRNIMQNLHPGGNYEELTSVRLVGMMLTIVVKKEIRPNVTRCSIQTVGTGALNFMGNKGGVGVSFSLNEADLCFINSHLAAHVSEVQRRNEDYAEIVKRLYFPNRTINDHDHIFWIGDLNYRLDGSAIDYKSIKAMLNHDQLRREMSGSRVFRGYTEGEIRFRPTYKYDPGTDNWDSSEKSRAPAWCDRVLWKGQRIEQTSYGSVMEMRLSDHKPVYSTFFCGIKTKDEQKYKRVHEEVLKRVDKYENDNQPQITVEKTDLDFDEIKFNETYIRDFTVANNCHLPVKFSFLAKTDNEMRICEDWVTVEPSSGNLITGTSLSIRVKIFVDSKSAWRLNNKQKTSTGKIALDILVLHVDKGRDIFITIMGEYKPSCFGFSIETLCRTDRPIAELNWSNLIEIEKTAPNLPYKVTMPREIFLLIDYLYKTSMKVMDLFQIDRLYSKNPNINEIRDWLDCWSTDEFPGTPHTAAEALLMILESSEESLLHPFESEILATDSLDQCLNVIRLLTTPRKNVFLYLSMFLQELIEQGNCNIDIIARIFGSVLLKSYTSAPDISLRRKQFMKRFLSKEIFNYARAEFQYSPSDSVRD